jgi:hypothetical protein
MTRTKTTTKPADIPPALNQVLNLKAEIMQKLEHLRRAVETDAAAAAETPKDWGIAGNLSHVNELLGEVLGFMNG